MPCDLDYDPNDFLDDFWEENFELAYVADCGIEVNDDYQPLDLENSLNGVKQKPQRPWCLHLCQIYRNDQLERMISDDRTIFFKPDGSVESQMPNKGFEETMADFYLEMITNSEAGRNQDYRIVMPKSHRVENEDNA